VYTVYHIFITHCRQSEKRKTKTTIGIRLFFFLTAALDALRKTKNNLSAICLPIKFQQACDREVFMSEGQTRAKSLSADDHPTSIG